MNNGWRESTIGRECDVIAGQSPDGKHYNKEGDGLPFYQGKKEFGEKFLGPPDTWTRETSREAATGDVLMSVRAPVGPINFATERICIGRGLAAIRAGKEIDRDFLFYSLLAKQDEIHGTEGAVYPSINKTQIQQIGIAVPPLGEQKRIVGILDEAFAGIAAAVANAEKNLANARELFDSHLNAVFGRKGPGWDKLHPLSSALSIQPRNGWSPPRKFQTGSGHPVITLSAVTGYVFDGSKVTLSSAPTRLDAHYWLTEGELLITRSNTRQLVGHVAVCDGMPNRLICSDLIMKMTVDAAVANTRFVYYWLRTAMMRKYIMSRATGASSTMKKIGKAVVQGMPIPLPPVSEQSRVVRVVDGLAAETQRLESVYRRKLQHLADLKQSILHKAFAGELTAKAMASEVVA